MVEALHHEDFYVTGTWVEESWAYMSAGLRERTPSPTGCLCEMNGETSCSFFQARNSRNRERPSASRSEDTNSTWPALVSGSPLRRRPVIPGGIER